MKDMSVMKQAANHVSRTQKDISRLRDEISSIEKELAATGSTRTADDVQLELDALSVEMYGMFIDGWLGLIEAPADGQMSEKNNLLRPSVTARAALCARLRTTCPICVCARTSSPTGFVRRPCSKSALRA
jgi:hypothetical protein